jgi:ribosomal protein L11 methyltransferase
MWQLEFELPRTSPTACQDMLSDLFETLLIFESEDKSSWAIKLILTEEPTEATTEQIYLVTDTFGLNRPEVDVIQLPNKDWLAENRKDFPAMTIAGFFIHGSHLASSNDDSLIGIQVDASLAFGTGEHATTRGCLEMIKRIQQPEPGDNILDLGCGTAILAIAMAKLWDRDVWASDIDEDSVMMAWQNCIDNHVGTKVHTLHCDGFNHAVLQELTPFGLIVANILADPLCKLAPEMKSNLSSQGSIILSGLLVEQKELVKLTYENQGFKLMDENIIGEWATLLFKPI